VQNYTIAASGKDIRVRPADDDYQLPNCTHNLHGSKQSHVLSILYFITYSLYSCCSFRICMYVWYVLLNIYLLTYLIMIAAGRHGMMKMQHRNERDWKMLIVSQTLRPASFCC